MLLYNVLTINCPKLLVIAITDRTRLPSISVCQRRNERASKQAVGGTVGKESDSESVVLGTVFIACVISARM